MDYVAALKDGTNPRWGCHLSPRAEAEVIGCDPRLPYACITCVINTIRMYLRAYVLEWEPRTSGSCHP